MPLRVEIRWANAPHQLLPEPGAPAGTAGPEPVQLRLGGSPLTPVAKSLGRRDYRLTQTSGTVELHVRFTVKLGAVSGSSVIFPEHTVSTTGETHDVLAIDQKFDLVEGGAKLRPIPQDRYDGRPHPLIDMKTLRVADRGVAPVHIFTDFVDITPFWEAYAASYDYYLGQGGNKGARLVALGRTNGEPPIWFAHVPDACAGGGAAFMGCLVFYRPEVQDYTYTRIDQLHEMFPLARYLLTPDPNSQWYFESDFIASHAKATSTFPQRPDKADKLAYVIRCGMEDALSRSGKRVVLLQPWPQGTSFGSGSRSAFAPKLWSGAVVPAMRLLHAIGRIKRPRSAYLGLSAFSSGAGPLWAALEKNMAKVAEVYAFDPEGTEARQGIIQQWHKLGDTPFDRHLRLVGSTEEFTGGRWVGSIATHRAIRDALLLHYGESTIYTVSALPQSIDSFDLDPNISDNPYWLHVVKARAPGGSYDPNLFNVPFARHQFCMFGGYPTEKRPATETFLLQFLRKSDFPG